ncbi:hypothetical protein CBF34_02380 [Vagococcus penaei]|uniref:Uncharacterized protein n=1 Tax=Vagococcus penaei TaxID=633807 RepID=A0A1Q2D7T8_9ENTE|nr:ABC transporter ATP-binding protein [Vagococcus penaei]AQP54468.1 hypothetical protein BW732_09685 [Vagococcus penaei]RSU06387.1 hypothetical protein CBF34_02380 [Vagococcus penaei]
MGIQLKDMSKSVDGLLVLNDINLTLKDQTIYGLIGQNNSGKTTLLRVLANLRYPSEGYVEIDSEDIFEQPKVMSKVYFQSQDAIYPKHATLKKIMKWMNDFYASFQIDSCRALLFKYALKDTQRFAQLSIQEQMIFRCCLACSIDTDYLLLDDPTFALDPSTQNALFQDILASYQRYPKTIVLSTHSIIEIERLVDRIIIIEDGQVIVEDAVKELTDHVYVVEGTEREMRDFLKQRNVLGQDYLNGNIRAYTRLTTEELTKATHLSVKSMNLQELFIQLTRNPFQESGVSL